MHRSSRLSRKSTNDNDAASSTTDRGLERFRDGLLTLARDRRQDDLSLRQLAVLALLVATQGPHTIRGFAAKLRVAKPSITRAVDRLEMEGLAQRLPDPSDGRSILVEATPRGNSVIRTVGAAFV
jgi:DNA-binding MarR family transcriptional regulator